jgi:hypothetical protein
MVKEECPYRESLFCIIGIHMSAVLSIKEHLEPQIVLVDRTLLLYPIHLANVNEKCYRGPFGAVPDHGAPVLTLRQIGTEPSLEVRLTSYSRSSVKYLLSYLLNLSMMSWRLSFVVSA